MSKPHSILTRILGIGLAATIAVITTVLWATGQLGLYMNPAAASYAVPLSLLMLAATVAVMCVPLGAEAEHDHAHDISVTSAADAEHSHSDNTTGSAFGRALTVIGSTCAIVVVTAALVLPAATLSPQQSLAAGDGTTPLFAGADTVVLAASGDTSSFEVGDWASVFQNSTSTTAFDGVPVKLTGFVNPTDADQQFRLTRLVITHCVIDAQAASVPISTATMVVPTSSVPPEGQWVEVDGTVHSTPDGTMYIAATSVSAIDQPKDPYEY